MPDSPSHGQCHLRFILSHCVTTKSDSTSPFSVGALACGLDCLHKSFNSYCGLVTFKFKPWQKLPHILVWDPRSWVFWGHSGWRGDLPWGGCVVRWYILGFIRLPGQLWCQHRPGRGGSIWLKHHSPTPILPSQRYQRTLTWRIPTTLVSFQNVPIHHDLKEVFMMVSESHKTLG